MGSPDTSRPSRRHRIEKTLQAVLMAVLRPLPYRWRVALGGRLAQALLSRGGARRRIDRNLALIFPGTIATNTGNAAARDAIRRAAADNIGRVIIELWSGRDFIDRAAAAPLAGPGLSALTDAHAAHRPVILATAHFGNYYAIRAALAAAGMPHATIYKPLDNPLLNARYTRLIALAEGAMFPLGRRGLGQMLRHLGQGGKLGILIDYASADKPPLPFLGKPAPTALSAAEMALRHNALLLPVYATRQPDGLSFVIEIEAPVPHSDPVAMTQHLNDSASARILAQPGQWFWPLQRWKALLASPQGDGPG